MAGTASGTHAERGGAGSPEVFRPRVSYELPLSADPITTS
jgi:hypothetical protein